MLNVPPLEVVEINTTSYPKLEVGNILALLDYPLPRRQASYAGIIHIPQFFFESSSRNKTLKGGSKYVSCTLYQECLLLNVLETKSIS